MTISNTNWEACAAELGLELVQLAPLEAVRTASLDMHGLDPGQEDQLPPEEQSKIKHLGTALKLLESFGGLAGLPSGGGGWQTLMLRGEHQGYRVSVHSVQANQETETGISLRFPRPLGFGLRIVREGFGHKLGKLLRLTQDLQLEDETLDPLVLIQAEQVEGAKTWLSDPGLREDLRDLFQLSEGIEVLDWGLSYRGDAEEFSPSRVGAVLKAMTPIARHVR